MIKNLALASVAVLFSVQVSQASMAHFKEFKAQYPNPGKTYNCKVCHEAVPKLNPYGQDFQKAKYDFKAIEELDSDGDGSTNIVEITKGTDPGDKASAPTP